MLTAIGLARHIAAGEVSAVEVVRAHLDRIEETRAINAVVALNPRALAEAEAAPEGPLHGVPFTVKDNIAVAGLPMAIGVPERAGVIAGGDATVVARLKQAGAIVLGKTNCPPWAGGIETDNPVYGRTNNPSDLERTPGGSSGGEAAIIAARGVGVRARHRLRREHPAARPLLRPRRPEADDRPRTADRVRRRRGPARHARRSAHGRRAARALGRRRRAAVRPDRRAGRARRGRRADAPPGPAGDDPRRGLHGGSRRRDGRRRERRRRRARRRGGVAAGRRA
jgi:hypothetical protein